QEGAPQPPHGATEEEDFVEEAASATEMLEEESGLRGRLTGIIGRDLGERRDEARQEPTLHSAPTPRIEPNEHLHDESPPMRTPEPTRLARDDLRRLHAALHELGECRKLLDAAVRHDA